MHDTWTSNTKELCTSNMKIWTKIWTSYLLSQLDVSNNTHCIDEKNLTNPPQKREEGGRHFGLIIMVTIRSQSHIKVCVCVCVYILRKKEKRKLKWTKWEKESKYYSCNLDLQLWHIWFSIIGDWVEGGGLLSFKSSLLFLH